MGFPFKKTPHKVYKSSTLQNVLVTFWYEPLQNEDFNDAFYERLDTFTMGKFGLHVERKFPNSALQILNNKNKTRLVFGRDKVYVILDCDGYVSFDDSAFPQAYHLKDFLKDVMIKKDAIRMSIRKINIWSVDASMDEKVDEEKIRKQIFSNAFLTCRDKEEMNEREKQKLMDKFYWNDKEQSVRLQTAFIPVDETTKKYNMVMDTEAVTEQARGISLNEMPNVLRALNDTMFDAFNWAVNKEIINKMEEGLYTL